MAKVMEEKLEFESDAAFLRDALLELKEEVQKFYPLQNVLRLPRTIEQMDGFSKQLDALEAQKAIVKSKNEQVKELAEKCKDSGTKVRQTQTSDSWCVLF